MMKLNGMVTKGLLSKRHLLLLSVGIVIIFILTIVLSYVFREDKDNYSFDAAHTDFVINYSIVGNLWKGQKDNVSKLLYIQLNSKDSGFAFLEFWKYRADRACNSYEKEINEIVLDFQLNTIKNSKKNSKEDFNKKMEFIKDFKKDRMNLCEQSFIFDNWDEINDSIEKRILNIKRESRFFWPFNF